MEGISCLEKYTKMLNAYRSAYELGKIKRERVMTDFGFRDKDVDGDCVISNAKNDLHNPIFTVYGENGCSIGLVGSEEVNDYIEYVKVSLGGLAIRYYGDGRETIRTIC